MTQNQGQAVIPTRRSWTGQASALTWHYEFAVDGRGDSSALRLDLRADDSTGGNRPNGPGMSIEVVGDFEQREFLAVLLDLVMALTATIGEPWEVYPTHDLGP
jgi:hypothetical protein